MFRRCLFCNADLGRNEVVEVFPVGRRLAFDAARGRLWVVCRACERWNLSPLEERFEAVEACEALYRDARLRAATENVGLAKRLPLGAALRMTLLGRHYRMPARRAYELGLVDELVAPADLLPTAEAMARAMLENSPQAMALSKQAVWGALERGYRDAHEHAWALLRLHWGLPDFAEGTRAFVEKRPPRWDPDPNARGGRS